MPQPSQRGGRLATPCLVGSTCTTRRRVGVCPSIRTRPDRSPLSHCFQPFPPEARSSSTHLSPLQNPQPPCNSTIGRSAHLKPSRLVTWSPAVCERFYILLPCFA